ncbi:SPOR domain-containing protein [Saccharospirillum impatiens]|uniref:SPOR domain-containing protein n=1 Tax=Saccharospirillum impatiens TaxID=169438 RepID=UPI00040CCCE8|nr:SPOR domain-containing protein [Saccharospirillum impatiens]
MARDFANKPPPPPPERSRIPRWVWVFTTLASVAFVGFLTYLSQIPADGQGAQALRDRVQQIQIPSRSATPEDPEPAPEAEAEASATPSLEQAFEFYRLLRDDEVPIQLPRPQTDTPASSTDAPSGTQAPATPTASERWIIQVASFSRVADADRLRAELIINGLTEAHLTTVDLGDRGIYHRVMVGPFDNRSRLNRAQDVLVELDHQVMVRNVN